MARLPKGYTNFADFEREHIRPEMRIGWSADDELENSGDGLDFDMDPFEAALWAAESEDSAD
ncbi:MAG TPA: transcriptional regulator [Polyangiaceae bacterium]|nr:transcriptional regulator [Polyangiaceae bacterium]